MAKDIYIGWSGNLLAACLNVWWCQDYEAACHNYPKKSRLIGELKCYVLQLTIRTIIDTLKNDCHQLDIIACHRMNQIANLLNLKIEHPPIPKKNLIYS